MPAKDSLGKILNKTVMTYLKVLLQCLFGETEENHEKPRLKEQPSA
jgi:hypothetical protein